MQGDTCRNHGIYKRMHFEVYNYNINKTKKELESKSVRPTHNAYNARCGDHLLDTIIALYKYLHIYSYF